MNFKNNISTTPEQSWRLLALGVKPETADMYYWYEGNPYYCPYSLKVQDKVMPYELREEDIPSWSLSRLLEMMPKVITTDIAEYHLMATSFRLLYVNMLHDEIISIIESVEITQDGLFEGIIDMIGQLVKDGYFNEDYLIHSNSSKTGKEDTK